MGKYYKGLMSQCQFANTVKSGAGKVSATTPHSQPHRVGTKPPLQTLAPRNTADRTKTRQNWVTHLPQCLALRATGSPPIFSALVSTEAMAPQELRAPEFCSDGPHHVQSILLREHVQGSTTNTSGHCRFTCVLRRARARTHARQVPLKAIAALLRKVTQ